MVPLFLNMGLGIALFSNAGKIFWGFHGDWDAVPDLHDFVRAIEESFAELRTMASEVVEVTPAKGSSRRKGMPRVGGNGAAATV